LLMSVDLSNRRDAARFGINIYHYIGLSHGSVSIYITMFHPFIDVNLIDDPT
jgi:hypothetical protein